MLGGPRSAVLGTSLLWWARPGQNRLTRMVRAGREWNGLGWACMHWAGLGLFRHKSYHLVSSELGCALLENGLSLVMFVPANLARLDSAGDGLLGTARIGSGGLGLARLASAGSAWKGLGSAGLAWARLWLAGTG